MTGYMFDRDSDAEWLRLDAQAQMLDPGSIRHLRDVGVGPGSVVAEIGGGGGTIADWLCRAVGPTGRVLATDLYTNVLDTLAHDNLEVRRHDIGRESLPANAFDVVHCRLVLLHLKERMDAALDSMVQALKPGGMLLVEDFEMSCRGHSHPENELQLKVGQAMIRNCAYLGVDANLGRRLWALLEARGLEDVGAEGRIPVEKFPSEALPALVESQRATLVDVGLLTEQEVDRAIAEMRGGFQGTTYWSAIIAAWGRRPSEG